MAEAGLRVAVLGSVHMDLIASAARLPRPGESVGGGVFSMSPGGKGGNQACQLALAGASPLMIARLGDDAFGDELVTALQRKGVDTSCVVRQGVDPTGASTVLSAQGDYASIIAPGAAALLSVEDVNEARAEIARSVALLLQFELPLEISAYAASIAVELNVPVILNASPAPARLEDVPEALWDATKVLVVNRVEAGIILGRTVDSSAAAAKAALDLHELFEIETVILTLGAEGSLGVQGGGIVWQPAFSVAPVDTVGAGDAFLGVAVTGMLEGLDLTEALRRGAAAGALAVMQRGAYNALPARAEIDRFLAGQD